MYILLNEKFQRNELSVSVECESLRLCFGIRGLRELVRIRI